MSEWKEYKLEDFVTIHNEKRVPLSKMERSRRQGKYPYYGASGIIDYLDDYLFDGEYILISEDGENLKSRQTPIAFKANGQFWVNNHAHIVKGKKYFHNNLIIYYFKNLNLNPFITGAVQPKLNKANLRSIPIFLPINEGEQRAIAEVLSSLDDKIDLLHRHNKTLEQMAETLFRQWFVDEAKEEWEEGTMGDLIDIKYGKDHKKLLDGNVPVYGSGGIMRYAEKPIFEYESVLIPRKGTLSNVTYINEPFWTVDTMFYTIMKKPNLAKFIYHFVKEKDLASMNVGSAVPSMTTQVLNNMTLKVPFDKDFEYFEKAVNPFYLKMKSNNIQIRTLEKIRDTLLPKLMSGEVRVKY